MKDTKETIDRPKSINEPVFTAEEVAKQKKLHPSTVRKLFVDEPGVIRMGVSPSRRKRQYYTLRIPANVVERVFERMTVRADAPKRQGP